MRDLVKSLFEICVNSIYLSTGAFE